MQTVSNIQAHFHIQVISFSLPHPIAFRGREPGCVCWEHLNSSRITLATVSHMWVPNHSLDLPKPWKLTIQTVWRTERTSWGYLFPPFLRGMVGRQDDVATIIPMSGLRDGWSSTKSIQTTLTCIFLRITFPWTKGGGDPDNRTERNKRHVHHGCWRHSVSTDALTYFFGCVRYNTQLKSFSFFFLPVLKEFRIFKDRAIRHCQGESAEG